MAPHMQSLGVHGCTSSCGVRDNAGRCVSRVGRGEVMKWDTKILIGACGIYAAVALLAGSWDAASGFFCAFLGWMNVGLKERREVT